MPRDVALQDDFFPGFKCYDIDTSGARIRCRVGGQGSPLLLLHGSPQTHVMWRKVAKILEPHFTIVVCDLRGYGDSSKPRGSSDHEPYSKRAMAKDMVEVMDTLGFPSFHVAGHDRGGRVAHRLALDHRLRVNRVAALDIAPTREMYAKTSAEFARAYWHWFFLIQPSPLPETMIAADVDQYFSRNNPEPVEADARAARAEYLRCFRDPATIHAICEDYRAAATIDLRHDDEDNGLLVDPPLLALWGADGVINRCFDVEALWRTRARDVTAVALPGGHHFAEQRPESVARELLAFFR